jgi:hypothetical protein
VKSRLQLWATVVAGLALAGTALHPLELAAWTAARAAQPALRLDTMGAVAGQGVALGMLGGFRAILADFTWIRMYTVWETHDLPTTATLIRLVTTLDPRPAYFWLNGARIVAYDMTSWRILAAGGYERLAEPEQRRIAREQGQLALRALDAGLVFHATSAEFWIERANIELNGLHDVAAAAQSYRRAWEQPHAPYYAARLHAELLRKDGQKRAALDWLIKLYPQLPPGDEAADAPLVLARIRELERELAVPALQSFRPAPFVPAGKAGTG